MTSYSQKNTSATHLHVAWTAQQQAQHIHTQEAASSRMQNSGRQFSMFLWAKFRTKIQASRLVWSYAKLQNGTVDQAIFIFNCFYELLFSGAYCFIGYKSRIASDKDWACMSSKTSNTQTEQRPEKRASQHLLYRYEKNDSCMVSSIPSYVVAQLRYMYRDSSRTTSLLTLSDVKEILSMLQ